MGVSAVGISFVCDNCGCRGRDEQATIIEALQCPVCGEPVVPWPERPTDTW